MNKERKHIFIVTMYRFGQITGHRYILGVYDETLAWKKGAKCALDRDKYEFSITKCVVNGITHKPKFYFHKYGSVEEIKEFDNLYQLCKLK